MSIGFPVYDSGDTLATEAQGWIVVRRVTRSGLWIAKRELHMLYGSSILRTRDPCKDVIRLQGKPRYAMRVFGVCFSP